VYLYAFDILAMGGDDLWQLPLSMRKTNLARLLPAGRPAFSSPRSSRARSVLTCSKPPATWG
jgi:ATP-dependent DNA ligase